MQKRQEDFKPNGIFRSVDVISITCILGVGTHNTCFDDSLNAYHFYTQWNSGGWCMFLQYMKCNHSYCNISMWEINWHKFFIALPQPRPKEHTWESSNSKYISNVCIKYWCHWALLHSSEMSHDQEQRWKWISIRVNGLNVFKHYPRTEHLFPPIAYWYLGLPNSPHEVCIHPGP